MPKLAALLFAATAAATAAAATIDCETAVVGGGWAGVYAAWRLAVDTATVKPTDVCLFEARAAVGGRTYSVEIDGMVIDVGAYRFGKNMHLPADLIINKFKLPVACYEPSCSPNPEFNATLYRVVDAHGHNAGYATPVRKMAAELAAAGVRIFYHHEMTGIYDDDAAAALVEAPAASSMLHFAGGAVARARAVLLNLPRVAIERLDPASVLFGTDPLAPPFQVLRNCTPCTGDVGKGNVGLAVKVYALYDDPWWLTKLNLSEGTFTDVGAAPPRVCWFLRSRLPCLTTPPHRPVRWLPRLSSLLLNPERSLSRLKACRCPRSSPQAAPKLSFLPPSTRLVGRYHDGPVTRDASGRPVGPGALEAVYTFTFQHPEIEWYVPFAADPAGDPLTLTTDPALVGPVHARLMAYHAHAFAAKGLNASDVPSPAKIALGLWTSDRFAQLSNPASANLHWMIQSCPAEACLDGTTPRQYNALIGAPSAARDIHIANNDFTWTGDDDVPCCWAEQSLKSVERTLHKAWALPQPEWLDGKYWAELITE